MTETLGLAHHARAFPEKPALVMGDARFTYGALNARVNRLARALRHAGIGRGDAVGAVLHNGCEWFELLNAAGKLGAQLVPIGYRLKAPEIAREVLSLHERRRNAFRVRVAGNDLLLNADDCSR